MCIFNISESIIHDAIYDHIRDNNILCSEQIEFRPGRSCNLQLQETLQEWSYPVDKGDRCDIFHLKYCKAFENVTYEWLLKELEAVGITRKFCIESLVL